MTLGQSPSGDLGTPARPPGRPTTGPGLRLRLVATAALLAVAFLGIRASIPATSWGNGPLHTDGVPLGVGLEVVFAGLLIAVERRRRRSPATAQPAASLRSLLRVALLIGLLGLPVLLLLDAAGKIKPRPQRVVLKQLRHGLPTARPHQLSSPGGGGSGALLLYILLGLLLAAALITCVVLIRRHAGRVAWDDSEYDLGDDQSEEQLRRAVASGQAAMREVDDARLAIIACYVAMEQSLAKAGTVRSAAETPDELLGRAATDGLVHGAEAGRLTQLFYEARFSTHPLPPARRDEARRALEALAASLEVAADALAADAAAGPPGAGTNGPATGPTNGAAGGAS
jgi:Domain of unknown function (DUF4129)